MADEEAKVRGEAKEARRAARKARQEEFEGNVARYYEVEPHRKLVYDHGGTDDRPPLFRVTVTFTEAGGKTTMKMILKCFHPDWKRKAFR